MFDPTVPPHARPGLTLEERARRLELAVAGCAERGAAARGVLVEGLEAAVEQEATRRENERDFARFVGRQFHD